MINFNKPAKFTSVATLKNEFIIQENVKRFCKFLTQTLSIQKIFYVKIIIRPVNVIMF